VKLKLTLDRGNGHPNVDLLVSVDPETTVGSLADHLARSDPDLPADPAVHFALARPGRAPVPLDRARSITDALLSSGETVRLLPVDEISNPDSVQPAVAVLVVLAGPNAGMEFPLTPGTTIVGRDRNCDVHLTDPLISRRHARIHIADSVEIADLGSANGVLIGDMSIDTATLRAGDQARLGDTVISIRMERSDAGASLRSPTTPFNRPPRIEPTYEGRKFTLPEPPAPRRDQRFPIIPLFAPLLMGAALYLSTRSTTSLLFMAMSPLMMVGNVAEGQLAGKRSFRRELEEFRLRLEELREAVATARDSEVEGRRAEYPSVEDCAEAIRTRDALLWSRRPDLPGFGKLRLGLGRQPSRSKIDFPTTRQGDPMVARELHAAFDELTTVDGVPVVVDFDSTGPLGVSGTDDRSRSVARGYILQLAALYSPAELAIYGICGPRRTQAWEWLKWLPHCGSTQGPLACEPLASNHPSSVAILGDLELLVRARSESRSDDQGPLPRVVVLIDEPPDGERSRLVEIAERGKPCGVWMIWAADDLSELPACCKTVVSVSEADGLASASFVDSAGSVDPLSVEELTPGAAEGLARILSPVVDAAARGDSQDDLPRSVSLVALVGRDVATSPDRVVERWTENRSVLSGPRAPAVPSRGRAGNLRALLGATAVGPHVLDLRSHGPHALVGGTTGAGKSELLQSWIIGMALSNSPQRLTFLLVDYKGGSAFSDCVHLPHTVGLVTDLSPHLVRRALTSLAAELRYREHILQRKRAKDLASLEEDGDPEAPPSLVIVVDEFAALVKEVPDFVDGVVNVAQRGRSLGLHLILATQRPAGVIRDNLRANTNLRVALRMADAADSTDVIGTKVAAGFDPSTPGRAVSRTGPTALIPFQTAYVGGWTPDTPEPPDIVAATFGFSPKTTWAAPVDDDHRARPAEGPTDIQRLVTSIARARELAEIPLPRKPWLAELAPLYNLAMLPSRRRDDELVFAVADDPANQSQPAISFRPDVDGNMAIFGTGNSGKTTLLRSLCLAAGMTARGGPCHVYALDFAGRGLQALDQLPHVGSVISGADTERVSRLFEMLRGLIDSRATEFAKVGAGSISQYRAISGKSDEPRLLILVDGMGSMRTAYEGTEHHRLFERFLAIAADGRQAGVHVVLAADRAGAVPSALGALIQRRVVLRLAAEGDYAMLGQATDVLTPKSPPGRGLSDGLEIQVALLGEHPDVLAQDRAIAEFAAAMRRAGTRNAPGIAKLGDTILLSRLDVGVQGQPTFGVAADTLEPVGFAPSGTFTVAGPPGSGRSTTLATMVRSFRRWRPDARLVYLGQRRSSLSRAIPWDHAAFGVAEVAALASEVPGVLGDANDGAAPGLVVIEEIAEFLQTPADAPLQDMIKRLVAQQQLVVSDGEPLPLSGIQALAQAARASRIGIVLQPEQSDAILFRTQFPRTKKADFPPGRGLYQARGRQPVVVQVALDAGAADGE
jgi:S-DNA-T family DNA segregation ATPase FtsK/SpoIIIE